MPYDASKLTPVDAKAGSCAVAWVRFWLREHDDAPVSDAEYLAVCTLDALTDSDGTVYYRPHVTASRLYRGDVDLVTSRRVGDVSVTQRDPAATVTAWLDQGAVFDRQIPLSLFRSALGRLVF